MWTIIFYDIKMSVLIKVSKRSLLSFIVRSPLKLLMFFMLSAVLVTKHFLPAFIVRVLLLECVLLFVVCYRVIFVK